MGVGWGQWGPRPQGVEAQRQRWGFYQKTWGPLKRLKRVVAFTHSLMRTIFEHLCSKHCARPLELVRHVSQSSS